MESIFFNMVGVSVTSSIIIILLLLLSTFLNERYTVKWRYFIWLFLAIRLILPIDFGMTEPPLEVNLRDHEVVYSIDESKLADLAPPELSVLAEDGSTNLAQREAYEKNMLAYDTQMLAAKKAAGKTITISQVMGILYLLGIAFFLIWQIGLYLTFRQATGRWHKEITNQQILEIYENLRIEMGIIKPLKIRVCKKILSPMIVGLRKPTLLLPHEGYQKIDLEVILKHELIHFKRNDLWLKLLLLCANAVHWFNPIIYRMVNEANKDIEISCDEEVLNGADLILRKRYSDRILELMQGNSYQEAPISTNFHGGKGMMKSRIQNIFDERRKKKGIFSLCLIMTLVLLFSACQFDISQNKWQIPIMKSTIDPYGQDKMGNRNTEMVDFSVGVPLDMDKDGKDETTFSLLVSEEGKTSKLKYEKDGKPAVQKEVFLGIDPGVDYGIQVANMEDLDSIMLLISIDYRGMPFGSGYWEMYSWKDGKFEKVDLKPVEENLSMEILELDEINQNPMNAGVIAYLYDKENYPKNYPVAGLYFQSEVGNDEDGSLTSIDYAPLSAYDVEGYHTWGQDAINKTMIGMNLVSGENEEEWKDPSRALLETEEVVFITLPNITATVKSYYQYENGKWKKVVAYIE